MTMEWFFDSNRDCTKKLCCSKDASGFKPQRLREMSIWPQLLEERQEFFDSGLRALPNLLEVYMGEVAWLAKPTRGLSITNLHPHPP